jgi:tetratricopeptide (TPR) repeat protein
MPKAKRIAIETVPTPTPEAAREVARSKLLDVLLAVSFLGLTFLLGVFPLQDTDFWWHLRTGDLIRQTGRVPAIDPYLFGGAAEKPWIDLHWIFQVLVSAGYQLGGVDLLTLAKCAVTTLGVGLLLLSGRAKTPLWVRIAAWTPALLLLAGRMYVRPETLTFLYMAVFLVVIDQWRERPMRTLVLPLVQVLWVNTQGLFVIGPILIGFGLIDAALSRGSPALDRRWWAIVMGAAVASGLACLVNPYGLRGALFPLALLGTMNDRIFDSIAELMPLDRFIAQAGWWNVPLGIHLATLAVGVLSFAIPLGWSVVRRLRGRESRATGRGGRRPRGTGRAMDGDPPWRLRPFRLLAFAAFAWLSWKATRNSHQLAAVAGAVSAWNLGEWAAALGAAARRRGVPAPRSDRPTALTAAGVVGLVVLVGLGWYYDWVGEGREVGLGEAPLWFPHEAARLSATPGMPDRSVCFHNGHSAVWIYHNGPERKTFADARLEVIGPDLYRAYRELQDRIATGRGWEESLAALGRPSLLLDHTQVGSAALPARVLASPNWRCVYFDAIASVFVPRESPVELGSVDFSARHFEPDPATDPADGAALASLARTCHDVAALLESNPTQADRLILLGQGYARRAVLDPTVHAEAWKRLGMLEMLALARSGVDPRDRLRAPFDPLRDPPMLRALFALERAREDRPDDFVVLTSLLELYRRLGVEELVRPVAERLAALAPRNPTQREVAAAARASLPALRARLGAEPSRVWSNRAELDALVERLLDSGRARTAAEVLDASRTPAERTWAESDRLATLWLRLGEPAEARAAWAEAGQVPRPSLRQSRIGWVALITYDLESARGRFAEALREEPDLFEARLGLARLELDAGRRDEARRAIAAAREVAPDEGARRLLDAWAAIVEPPISP